MYASAQARLHLLCSRAFKFTDCSQSGGGIDLQPGGADSTLLLSVLSVERYVQAQALAGGVGGYSSLRIGLGDKLLTASIYEQTNEIRAHVVAREICQSFGEMALVQINLITG